MQLGREPGLDGDAARVLTQRSVLALLGRSLPGFAPEHRERMRALWEQPPPALPSKVAALPAAAGKSGAAEFAAFCGETAAQNGNSPAAASHAENGVAASSSGMARENGGAVPTVSRGGSGSEDVSAAEAALAAPAVPIVRGMADRAVTAAVDQPLQTAAANSSPERSAQTPSEPGQEATGGRRESSTVTGCVTDSDRAVYGKLAQGYVWKLDLHPCAAP